MSKIYELAEQAAEHAVVNPSDSILQSETEDAKVEVPKAFIDKFAELIIQECARVARNNTPDTEECEYTHLVSEAIKQHFGVEE